MMLTFKYCSLTWVFRGKTENKSINKIQNRTLVLIYDIYGRCKFWRFVKKGEIANYSWKYFTQITSRNLQISTVNYPTNNVKFFRLKEKHVKPSLKLFVESTWRAPKHYASKEIFYGIKFQTNIKIWILSKNSRVKSNNGILLPVAVKYVNKRIL